MMFSTKLATILLGLTTFSLATHAIQVPRAASEQKKGDWNGPGRYIVTLKQGVNKLDSMDTLSSKVKDQWAIIPGFAVEADEETFKTLISDPDVEKVEEDGEVYAQSLVTQHDAGWGLARLGADGALNSTDTSANYTYTYDDSSGRGVDIYVIDTGIFVQHSQFGGRAVWGASFGGNSNADGNGHGTHSAGLIGGQRFGVAKLARLIAVKVLSDQGSGSISGVISGMNYVMQQAAASGRPSIANIAIGGAANSALDAAVAALTASGIHVVVAAGASNTNAGNTSPARAPSAITVGATDITDARALFSNYGHVVDIWAPGVSIQSAWIGSATDTRVLSGTSMSTAYISGLIAYLIGLYGNQNPAQMTATMQSFAQYGVLSKIPSGTANIMAHNGV